MSGKKDVPSFEDVPVNLVRSDDRYLAAVEDALIGLGDAQAQVKEARSILKEAQNALFKARRGR